MSTRRSVPVIVQGRVLKTEIESNDRSRIRESHSYIVWTTGTSVSGRIPVCFACAADEAGGPGKGSIRKSALEGWLPATALLNVPENISEIASEILETQCVDEVRSIQVGSPPVGMRELAGLLSSILETEVRVSITSEQGILSIDFQDLDDLERICALMTSDPDE